MENKKTNQTSKTFFQLKPEESKGLNDIVYKNARQLRNDALLIAQNNKSYSSANSLLILSSEEIIKAILILLHSEKYEVYKIEHAKKFFYDHKIRHQLAKLIEITIGIFESIDKFNSQNKVKLFNIKNDFLDILLNGIVDGLKATVPIIESVARMKKLEEFNTNKNNGLYVGFNNTIAIPNKLINETSFNQTKEIVDRIFTVYKCMKLLHNPYLKNHYASTTIDHFKDELTLIINDEVINLPLKELKI